jgi:hypothetical protein
MGFRGSAVQRERGAAGFAIAETVPVVVVVAVVAVATGLVVEVSVGCPGSLRRRAWIYCLCPWLDGFGWFWR